MELNRVESMLISIAAERDERRRINAWLRSFLMKLEDEQMNRINDNAVTDDHDSVSDGPGDRWLLHAKSRS